MIAIIRIIALVAFVGLSIHTNLKAKRYNDTESLNNVVNDMKGLLLLKRISLITFTSSMFLVVMV